MPRKTSKSKPKAPQLTAFVVIGFGLKTDYATGRVLNLDKTYEQLIQPACDRAEINAFRAIDANLTGSIDSIMYRWIYQADIVIADLSTLNANVFYELGVRHAQKPNTTIIMAESVLMRSIPFDLSSFVIHQYEHGGEEITEAEQERFVDHLASVLDKILEVEAKRVKAGAALERPEDSPVYTFLKGMTPPEFESDVQLDPPRWVPPGERDEAAPEEGESLAGVIDAAEAAKNAKEFARAIELFERAIEIDTRDKEKPDLFLAQRLALVTYKHGERKGDDGEIDSDRAIAALNEAEEILARYCAPKISTDPETLGLSGAINKRLFQITGDLEYLERSIRFYERGFYVKQDYYNGINVAFMYTERANLLDDRFDAIVSYGHANMIRKRVAEICRDLIDDEEAFANRGDREWVLMTLAEAYQGQGLEAEEARLEKKIEAVASDFGKDSYQGQRAKLAQAMEAFRQRVRPEELGGPAGDGVPIEAVPVVAPPASSEAVVSTAGAEPLTAAARPTPSGAIVIDANLDPRRRVRALEVHCKVEYAD